MIREEGSAGMDTFHWLDVQRIGEELADLYPERDPFATSFPDLRALIEQLDGFEPEADHPVNERILEAIQQHWNDEREGIERDDD
jgi:FeS assembly protein IscX